MNMHICISAYLHLIIYIYIYIHVDIHTYIHTKVYGHTYVPTKHIHIGTCTCTLASSQNRHIYYTSAANEFSGILDLHVNILVLLLLVGQVAKRTAPASMQPLPPLPGGASALQILIRPEPGTKTYCNNARESHALAFRKQDVLKGLW